MASTAYLDNACIGKIHPEVVRVAEETLRGFAELTGDPTEFTCDLFDRYEEGRSIIERVLNLEKNSVAYVENTSHGLGLIANALPLERDDNVLVCDLEFFSTVMCWKRHQIKTGFEVRPVKTSGGIVTVDDFKRVSDSHTKAIVVSSVQEINGYRVDIDELADFARSIGAYIIVDGIQEVGALDPSIVKRDVDVYCAGGHKWLRNPLGTGFLYINPKIVDTIEPDFYGYFNALPPESGWGPYLESPARSPYDDLKYVPGAAKFEIGATLNYQGAFGLVKSMECIEAEGIKTIETAVLQRRRYIQEGLQKIGASICGTTEEKHLSGICTFNLKGGIEEEHRLKDLFDEKNIYCSLRYVSGVGGIRLSAHSYTDFDEIDYMLETVKEFLEKR
ncbi:MAG: aminotransferase class V-fold PLP-dependent enzyme [Mogibacterium sp.]|nr:aminotransferase class V-fold PLP-dependent enzyme [Mogibacterium sp.]